ncbi:MAG: hypothetical protein KKG17_16230, partial [Alphaproteobacteria bacterium]|nr:hypothetical protein [Alphaproteobacteria bacterium]MBU1561101.1 hypothetical protein [Alphaproteobacteria bacterium]
SVRRFIISSVIGRPSGQGLVLQPEPYRKAPMTTALLTYTTSGDTTNLLVRCSLQLIDNAYLS